MDFYDWLRQSLLIATIAGLMNARSEASRLLKEAAPEIKDDSARSGWHMFALIFVACMASYALGIVNKFLGYPFT